MSREEERATDTTLVFEKFKDYYDQRFNAIAAPKQDFSSIKQLKVKLEAKELVRPGNIAQFEFCGNLEILLDNAKLALVEKSDPEAAVAALQEAEELIADRKAKIRIADGSKAGWATVSKLDKSSSEYLLAEQRKSVKVAEEEALKDLESRKRKRRDASEATTRDLADQRLFRGTHFYFFFSLHLCACRPTHPML